MCISQLTSLLSSSLVNPTASLVSPLGNLLGISKLTSSKVDLIISTTLPKTCLSPHHSGHDPPFIWPVTESHSCPYIRSPSRSALLCLLFHVYLQHTRPGHHLLASEHPLSSPLSSVHSPQSSYSDNFTPPLLCSSVLSQNILTPFSVPGI